MQKIPYKKRIESGAIQFKDDWPGLFLRGDYCMGLDCDLSYLIKKYKENPVINALVELKELLDEVIVRE